MIYFLIILLLLAGCSEEAVEPKDEEIVDEYKAVSSRGFYVLCEGNMGSNKATLDRFSYATASYERNIFNTVNPDVAFSLGDVGNDIAVYGSKLWAVINCSNLVEVMDVATARHVGQVAVPNCRSVIFHEGFAYVSSYAGPVVIDATKARLGYVAKIDTATLSVVDTCAVGYQPEEMAIVGGKLYVANSGGYMVPNYDRTLSVIDIKSFDLEGEIDVAINLHRVESSLDGRIFVSSRGDYYEEPSRVYVVEEGAVVDTIDVECADMTLAGDSLWIYGASFSYTTYETNVSYAIYDIEKREIVSRKFITDGTDADIDVPSGLAVSQEAREFYVCDAKDYVTPGTLHCYGFDGVRRWSATTGDIPAHFAFY